MSLIKRKSYKPPQWPQCFYSKEGLSHHNATNPVHRRLLITHGEANSVLPNLLLGALDHKGQISVETPWHKHLVLFAVGVAQPILRLNRARELRPAHPRLPFAFNHQVSQPARLDDALEFVHLPPCLIKDTLRRIVGREEPVWNAELDVIHHEESGTNFAEDGRCWSSGKR